MSARPRRARRILAAVAALAVLGSVAVAYAGRDKADRSGSAPSGFRRRTATTEVQRTDLIQRTSVDGTLGYAELDEQLVGRGSGTITGIAPEGSVVGRGQALYHLDGRPIPLLLGAEPMHRTLATGDEGADVRQLKENLIALGYGTWDGMGDDDEFGSGTRSAVERWQEALDVQETGTVALGQAVFLPTPVRIREHQVEVGAPLQDGTPIATLSTIGRLVTADLDVGQADLVDEGDPVQVVLPDGSTARGTVSTVAKVVDRPDEEGADPTVAVTVELEGNPRGASGVDEAPVELKIEAARRDDVLAVPVTALLALAEGGYGVERVEGHRHELVPVEPGASDDDRDLIEVSSPRLRAGDVVVVPR